jgi:hypothetical protein
MPKKQRTGEASEPDDRGRKYVLRLDGAYYKEAARQCAAASKTGPEYDKWVAKIQAANEEITRREAKYENRADAYDEIESLVIKLDRDWEEFEHDAQSFIQCGASVHILCVASLEAHINMRAEESLPKKKFTEFDKLSTVGKWLFYPQIASVGAFDPGSEPFQGFQQLIIRRNRLVHYKTQTDYRRYGYEVPSFVDELGIRVPDLRKSLKAVAGMVAKLAKMERREVPGWISGEWWGIFEH